AVFRAAAQPGAGKRAAVHRAFDDLSVSLRRERERGEPGSRGVERRRSRALRSGRPRAHCTRALFTRSSSLNTSAVTPRTEPLPPKIDPVTPVASRRATASEVAVGKAT